MKFSSCIKISKLKKIEYVIISIIIIFTLSSVYYVNNFNLFAIGSTAILGTVIILNIKNVFKTFSFVRDWQLLLILLYIVLIGAYTLFNNNGSLNCINIFFMVIPLIYIYWSILCQKKNEQKFIFVLVMCVTILSCISVICWFCISYMNVFAPNGSLILNWGKPKSIESFYNIYFLPQGDRNCSIFAEAPVFNYALCCTILLNEFKLNYNKKQLINLILIIAILTTQTTTGLIFLGMLFFYKIFKNKSRKLSYFILMILVLLIFIFMVIVIKDAVFKKIDEPSGQVRLSRINMEFEAFLESPLYGNGFGSFSIGSSNSFFSLLADGGIILWGFYYIPIILIILADIVINKKLNYFVIIFAVIFSVCAFQYTMFSSLMTIIMWDILIEKLFGKKSLNNNSEIIKILNKNLSIRRKA